MADDVRDELWSICSFLANHRYLFEQFSREFWKKVAYSISDNDSDNQQALVATHRYRALNIKPLDDADAINKW
jgi:hypothetical protein